MSFSTSFLFRHTGADAADSLVFGMRNASDSTRRIYIDRIILTVAFDGASAASHIGYGIARFSGANPVGGSSPERIKIHTSLGLASVIPDAGIKMATAGTVLTSVGATFEGYFHRLLIPTTVGSVACQVIDFLEPLPLELGEGIGIRTAIVAVIGLDINGSVWWREAQF